MATPILDMPKLIEISPRPTTVVELFTDHPERWCKGQMYRGEKGNSTIRDYAHSCCLGGAINLVYGPDNYDKLDKLQPLIERRTLHETDNVATYNDHFASFEDIISLAKEAGI